MYQKKLYIRGVCAFSRNFHEIFHEFFTKFSQKFFWCRLKYFRIELDHHHAYTTLLYCYLYFHAFINVYFAFFFIAVFFKHLFFFSILPPIRLWCHYSISCLLHPSTCFNSTSGDSLPLCYMMSWPLRFRNFDLLLSSYSRNLARFEPYVCYSSQTLLLLQYTATIYIHIYYIYYNA